MKTPPKSNSPAVHALNFTGADLTLDQLDAACHRPLHVSLSNDLWKKIADSRARIERMLAGGGAIYGVNTGFGKLCN